MNFNQTFTILFWLNKSKTDRKSEITKHYNILLSTKDNVTAEDIKNSYKGIREKKVMFMETFKQFIHVQLERKNEYDISESRYKKWPVLYNDCCEFIKYKYRRSDIPILDIKLSFINEFYHHLRTVN